MSRSHHVTASDLRKERLELAREGLWPLNHMTELEARDIQKRISKLNAARRRVATAQGEDSYLHLSFDGRSLSRTPRSITKVTRKT
jgi:hypothetical protein